MLGVLVLAAAVLAAGTGVWVRASTASAVSGDVPIAVAGTDLAPAVNAGALLAGSAALALALGGRWGARLAAAAIVLAGGLVAVAAVAGRSAADDAAASAAAQEVGVAVLDGPVSVTPLPWVAAALGLAIAVAGLRALVLAPRWSARSDRHGVGPGEQRPVEPTAGTDDLAAWDALTRGDDPTPPPA